MSARRKSVINLSRGIRRDQEQDDSAALELERLEQKTTLVLQDIDQNLSRANAVITDKMFPVLKKYAMSTSMVWENVAFWKRFMEEAADVEVQTSNETVGQDNAKTTAGSLVNKKVGTTGEVPRNIADESTNSLAQMQASTPQKPRSRASLLASQGVHSTQQSRRVSAGNQGVNVTSSNRNTPSRYQSENEARRSSIVYKHLNSSPTYPEPPILMSDIGKFNVGSSSSVVRGSNNARGLSSSDSDDSGLGRLSPVLLPSLTLTPGVRKVSGPHGGSAQRFPNTPVLGSSSSRSRAEQRSSGSPIRREREPIEIYPDRPDMIVPPILPLLASGVNESEEIVTPELTSLRSRGEKRNISDQPDAEKRRQLVNTEEGNIFMEQSNRGNSSTTYHTVVHDASREGDAAAESNSKSMSEIFDAIVLPGAPKAPVNAADHITNAPQSGLELRTIIEGAGTQIPALPATGESIAKEKDHGATGEERLEITENISYAADSSDLNPFYKERLRVLRDGLDG